MGCLPYAHLHRLAQIDDGFSTPEKASRKRYIIVENPAHGTACMSNNGDNFLPDSRLLKVHNCLLRVFAPILVGLFRPMGSL